MKKMVKSRRTEWRRKGRKTVTLEEEQSHGKKKQNNDDRQSRNLKQSSYSRNTDINQYTDKYAFKLDERDRYRQGNKHYADHNNFVRGSFESSSRGWERNKNDRDSRDRDSKEKYDWNKNKSHHEDANRKIRPRYNYDNRFHTTGHHNYNNSPNSQ